eukprot:4725715-Alexandrium_andersonii.AAC.1
MADRRWGDRLPQRASEATRESHVAPAKVVPCLRRKTDQAVWLTVICPAGNGGRSDQQAGTIGEVSAP